MKFRYVIETESLNGGKETSVQEFEKDEILVGRGTSCDILLQGRRVSLSHAKFYVSESSLQIEDQDSLSGILVNNSIVRRTELQNADVIKIGSFSLKVVKEFDSWGVLEKRQEQADDEDIEEVVTRQVNRLRFQSYIPSFTALSVVICLAILICFGALPLLGTFKRSWDSGPISNAHKMIENDCAQCHASAFTQVQDKQCMACHSLSDHAENMPIVFQAHADLDLRCAQCHMEHNGDADLILTEPALCADCHGRLDEVLPGTKTPSISSFDTHPEFRVTLSPDPSVKDGMPLRVSLSDKEKVVDHTQIKLNHKIHLEPDLAGENGPETLDCMSCHQFTPDFKDIEPISFEKDCQSCHPLEFDPRLPGNQVPHGNPDVVYNYLYAEYAKLFLTKEGKEDPKSSSRRRRKPGKKEVRAEKIEFSRSSVEEQSRNIEEEIFTRTGCHLCHTFVEKDQETMVDEPSAGSRFEIVAPKIPEDWMPGSPFDHGAHQAVACESCHVGVTKSEETKDVLLPGIENCRQCHHESQKVGSVTSDCITCHTYHDPLIMKEEKKRDIEKILLSFDFDLFERATKRAFR